MTRNEFIARLVIASYDRHIPEKRIVEGAEYMANFIQTRGIQPWDVLPKKSTGPR